MRKLFLLCSLVLSFLIMAEESDSLYKEKYRPQYHFTPAHRWIGDPCGLMKWNGKYHAYSWGTAVSDDMLYWQEVNDHAIKGLPANTSAFTGGVIVDTLNLAGYGRNVPLAVFTSFDEVSKKQSQSIAFSRDSASTFEYFGGNPVLDIWSTEFRDPTVVYDSSSSKWVMAVAKALEKKVAFYVSQDLRNWEFASDFGPMGDNEKSWECPDLFEISVEDEPGMKKWVLLVSVNWAREQYFVGEFNGREFIPDRPYDIPLYVDDGLDYYASRVFQNYDKENLPVYTLGWVNTWDYATVAPTTYGKGIWSLPREYTLYSTPEGYRLRQTPIKALESLRGKPFSFTGKIGRGITPFSAIKAFDNVYEAILEFSVSSESGLFGIEMCAGEGRQVSLTYNPATSLFVLDRINCTDADIPKFSRTATCNISPENGKITFRIFVDKSTVEIFVNDGKKVLTMLTFPSDNQTAFNLFSLKGNLPVSLIAYPLKSIH